MLNDYAALLREFPWLGPVLSFVFGAMVGSFLNVCIYRIPAGRSVIRPGSHCSCGKPVAWRDNIPILSWLLLRGKARCCGTPFSPRYMFIEALTGALFAVASYVLPAGALIAGWIFISCLLCATFIDIDHFEIPDVFSVGLGVLGVLLSIAFPALHHQSHDIPLVAHVRSGLIGFEGLLIGSGLVLWIALVSEAILRRETMGFGDVKFVGAIGAFCGWQGAVTSIFGGAILGSLWFAGALLYSKIRGKPLLVKKLEGDEKAEVGMGTHVPFGPMLAAAGLLHFLWLHTLVSTFFASVSD